MSGAMQADLLWPFLWLLCAHWLGDFVLQTHWQASNKSKRLDALSRHVMTYTLVMAIAGCCAFGARGVTYALVNGVLHLITDYFTSRASSRLYAVGEVHNFFVVIGLDQLIHQVTLAVTLEVMFG